MRLLAVPVLVAMLAADAGTAFGAGQTPPPGHTPGRTPGRTIIPGITPGTTPGQTPGSNAHRPVCPDEVHLRLPKNTGNAAATDLFLNCSDPDGKAATAALDYGSPGILPQHLLWKLFAGGRVTATPTPGYTGPDFFQYYAIDPKQRSYSNTTDFYVDIVAGLAGPTLVWTGTNRADDLRGTPGRDEINSLGGNDTITDTAGGASSRAVKATKKPTVFNRISSGSGNDTINVRNRKRDKVDCGKGKKDRVTADKSDSLKHCEKVNRKK